MLIMAKKVVLFINFASISFYLHSPLEPVYSRLVFQLYLIM